MIEPKADQIGLQLGEMIMNNICEIYVNNLTPFDRFGRGHWFFQNCRERKWDVQVN